MFRKKILSLIQIIKSYKYLITEIDLNLFLKVQHIPTHHQLMTLAALMAQISKKSLLNHWKFDGCNNCLLVVDNFLMVARICINHHI